MKEAANFIALELLPFWSVLFGLLAAMAWPVAAILIARVFRDEIRQLFGRVTKLSLSGAEFGVSNQNLISRALPSAPEELKKIPGVERTAAIANLEIALHEKLKEFDDDVKLDLLVRELAQTRLDVVFMNAYRMIFGSQIRLLKVLKEAGGILSIDEVSEFFEKEKKLSNVHEGRTVTEFISFLVHFNLVSEGDEELVLTPVGYDFLLFLFRHSFSENLPN